ncbi:hypothetical protein M422DRAFT_782951 [Sphaerobolus stellatus SS14]|uniref:non-specific serine/threonine protein kinase n=1 Tax=Sphaerobolus stellatus (strain SS14) TaxID=990650 RepID=A0A0C9VA54_SPHS4|nr:hypothetical protein M422DRAFT_782951 [Sphaerobolus stellatus SS14]
MDRVLADQRHAGHTKAQRMSELRPFLPSAQISHGDIKSENILVTYLNWMYLTDFASYKPTYLPLDDPADFSFFFDTSGRRTCYIAPERFYTAGSETSKLKAKLDFHERDGKVTETMDVFSLGSVIAELFLEGAAMITLSQLFKYRSGELIIKAHLAAIDDAEIRALILRMVALEPTERPTFDTLLHEYRENVFPEHFYSFLHDYIGSMNELSTAIIFNKPSPLPVSAASEMSGMAETTSLPSDSDHRIEKIWTEYETIEPHFTEQGDNAELDGSRATLKAPVRRRLADIFSVELYIPELQSKLEGSWMAGQQAALEDGIVLIILSLVMDLIHDEAAIVRAAALRTLVQVLMLVKAITPATASIFPEYIFPIIRYLYKAPDVSVRFVLAQCFAYLADTSQRYLEMGQALKAHGTFKVSTTDDYEEPFNEISYDACLQELQSAVQDILVSLLVDNSSVVKRAILHNVSPLCIFLGRQKTNDVLLGHMITYLNDRDWLLRHAFFESIVDVAACVGSRSLDEYIFPLMVQALSDEEETVVARVLASLTNVKVVNENSLLTTLKPPLPRPILEAAITWAMKTEKTSIWKNPSSKNRIVSKPDTPKEANTATRKQGSRSTHPPTDEDESYLEHIAKLARTIASSNVRAKETEPEALAQTTSGVELQKLGVVPQTVFVGGSRASESSRPSSRRTVSDAYSRHSISTLYGNPRTARSGSIDHVNVNEDLRRRLASLNGSSSSLTYLGDRERHGSVTSSNRPSAITSPIHEAPLTPISSDNRPPSPTESVVSSTVDGPANLRLRIHIGSTDNQKVAPTVGSVKTNVSGLLEAPQIPRLDEESLRSGRSSPVSNAGTIRAEHRSLHSARPYSLNFEIRDPGIHDLLEQLYHENSREAMHDFGPKVHEGAIRRRNAPRQSVFSMHNTSRCAEASLIANLTSHTGPINGVAVAPDHMFFLTCSDDKTVKVWDTARPERNVTSKPRQTYTQHHAQVTAVCMPEGFHCFASAGDDGSLHIVRVHITQGSSMPKYSKLQIVREHRVEQTDEYITALTHYNTALPSPGEATRGTVLLEVWDIESSTLVKTFETKDSSDNVPSQQPEVPLAETSATIGQDTQKDPAAAIQALLRLANQPSAIESPNPVPKLADVCAIVVGADFAGLSGMPRQDFGIGGEERATPPGGDGFIITGSEDRRIRLWHLTHIECSVILSR